MRGSNLENSQSVWWWIPCLSGIVAFQVCLIVCLGWIHHQHHFKSVEMAYRQLPELLKRDPPIGSPSAKLISEAKGQLSIPNVDSLLLIVLGSCEGCGRRSW